MTFIKSMAIDPYVNTGTSSGIFLPEGDLWVFTHSEEPADINYFAFYFLFGDGHLVVPSGTIEAYRAVDGWSQFGEYLERGDVNANGVIERRDMMLLSQYLNGEEVTLKNYYLGDINADGVVDENDLIALDNLLSSIYAIATDIQTAVDASTASSSAIYSLDGRLVASDRSALSSLPNGVYICQGRKIVVKN